MGVLGALPGPPVDGLSDTGRRSGASGGSGVDGPRVGAGRAGPGPCQNRGFSVCVVVPALIIIRTWSGSALTRCFHEGGGRMA